MSAEDPIGFRLSPLQRHLWPMRTSGLRVDTLVAAPRELDRAVVEASLASLARAHEILRTGFVEADGRVWQGVSTEIAISVDAFEAPGGELETVGARVRAIADVRLAMNDDERLCYVALVS